MSTDIPATEHPDMPRILVVDDSRLMRVAVKKILKKEYDLVEAVDGEEGWETLNDDDTIQVVISDLSMPNLDGFGLLEKIRTSEDNRIGNTPVIIITGNEDDDATKEKALNAGASDFVTKPFNSVQLRARVSAHAKHLETTLELTAATAALEENTNIDPLTHLANQRFFLEKGNECVSYAKRHNAALSLIRLDIDDFNNFFIKVGRYTADQALIRVGEILSSNIRQEDTVARLGVARFGVLLSDSTPEGASQLAHRIKNQIAGGVLEDRETLPPLTISMGISALAISPDGDFDQLLSDTEQQLAQALESGGDCICASEIKVAISPEDIPDMDSAISMADSGHKNQLTPFLPALLTRLLPLLELADKRLELGLDDVIKKIRELDR